MRNGPLQDPQNEVTNDFYASKKFEFLQMLASKGQKISTCRNYIEEKGVVSLDLSEKEIS